MVFDFLQQVDRPFRAAEARSGGRLVLGEGGDQGDGAMCSALTVRGKEPPLGPYIRIRANHAVWGVEWRVVLPGRDPITSEDNRWHPVSDLSLAQIQAWTDELEAAIK